MDRKGGNADIWLTSARCSDGSTSRVLELRAETALAVRDRQRSDPEGASTRRLSLVILARDIEDKTLTCYVTNPERPRLSILARKRADGVIDRALAVSFLCAKEARADRALQALRREVLKDLILSAEEVAGWINRQAQRMPDGREHCLGRFLTQERSRLGARRHSDCRRHFTWMNYRLE
jgi:hypothetical protein